MHFFCGEALLAIGLACGPLSNPTAFDKLEQQLASQNHVVGDCRSVHVSTRMWHTLPRANEHSVTIYSAPVNTIEGIANNGRQFELRHHVGFDSVKRWSVTEEARDTGENEILLHGKNPETEETAVKAFISYTRSPSGLVTDLRDPKGRSLCSTTKR